MTAVVEMASIPPWRQAILEKKRRSEEIEQAGSSSIDSTSGRKKDFLSKTQISDSTFFYSHSGQSSARDLNRNDTRPVGKSAQAKPSERDVEILSSLDSPEWNISGGEKAEGVGRGTVNNMVSHTRQSEANANGPTPSSLINGALVDEERIGSVHDNPFVKNFGLRHVVKPTTYTASVSSESSTNSAGNRLNSSEADMPEMEEDNCYRPGSGFVHRILDKFALLTAREEALHPSLNHFLPKRSSSLENLVDNDTRKISQRVSVGDEVFTTSPKSNLQYYSKAKSVENLTQKPTADRSVSESFDSRRRSGSEHREGRHRSGSELRRSHPAPDANLGREDIIIIETTPSPRPLEEDPLKHASRRRRTSSSERHLEPNELPKPNTVSSYRRKFESARTEKNDVVKQRKKKDAAPAAPTTATFSNNATTNGSKQKPADNLPDVIKLNGESSRDSSFDTQNDISADDSLESNSVEKDYENPVYDKVRASLRHVKLNKEEEITYSWRKNTDQLLNEGKPNFIISNNVNNTSVSRGNNVSKEQQHKSVNTAPKPAPTTPMLSVNNSNTVQSVSYKSTALKESQPSDKVKNNINTQPQQKTDNLGQQNEKSVRENLNDTETKTISSTSVANVSRKADKIDDNDGAVSTDSKEVKTSVNLSAKKSTSSSSGSKKAPAPKPPVVKATEPAVSTSQPSATPKVMVNVGPKASSDSEGQSYRSRNRFAAGENEDQGYVPAGKTWFYQAGKFKANPEGVKRPNNSQSQDPVPKKRTSPAPPNVTVLNLTDEVVTPRSNIDDYINGSSQDIPVTDIDAPDDVRLNLGRGAPQGNGVVPRLDLTGITSETKKPVPSQRGSQAQKKIQPCNYQFTGGNVVVGHGLLQTKKKAPKLKLYFDDSLNSTYEYPSEELMLEEYLTEHPDEKELILTLSDYIADTDESSDDIEEVGSPKEDQRSTLMSTPGVGNQSLGLSSYRSKNQIDYQFGMEFERQAEKEREQMRKEQAQQEIVTDDGDLIPADEDDMSGFSASSTSDILF